MKQIVQRLLLIAALTSLTACAQAHQAQWDGVGHTPNIAKSGVVPLGPSAGIF